MNLSSPFDSDLGFPFEITLHTFLRAEVLQLTFTLLFEGGLFWNVSQAIGILDEFLRFILSLCLIP